MKGWSMSLNKVMGVVEEWPVVPLLILDKNVDFPHSGSPRRRMVTVGDSAIGLHFVCMKKNSRWRNGMKILTLCIRHVLLR